MSEEIIKVPDIGSGSAEVIEICVKPGDSVDAEDSLIVLESDKATMEVPAPRAGQVTEILLKEGDSVSEGDNMLKMAVASAGDSSRETGDKEISQPSQPKTAGATGTLQEVRVPDIGAEDVPVIEISVKPGDTIAPEDSLVVLESDKATMEVPSPIGGVVKEVCVKEGDTLSQGDLVVRVESDQPSDSASEPAPAPAEKPAPAQSAPIPSKPTTPAQPSPALDTANRSVHAGPAVRRLAREFGVDLSQVSGSGPKGRILKEDVQAFVKARLNGGGTTGSAIPTVPAQEYSKWGEVETVPLNRLRKLAAQNFQRSWLNVPHVTQFDEANITELESFRKANKGLAESKGTKLTPLPFFLKAVAYVLKEIPVFCASLSEDGESVVYKKYVNIGVAVDTPDGLLVPVIKNVDQKGIWALSQECIELAGKAREKKLKPDEMQGGCFTISSLGSIGGTAFTPIVNAPEVAILGISKADMKPVWNGSDFAPQLICPLSLSYDHRVVNGADAARFTTLLGQLLSDIRRLLL